VANNGVPVSGAPLLYSSGAPHTWCAINVHISYSRFPSSGMKPENFRITLGYLNGDMHVPNNKNIIFLLDSREREFETSNSNS
jgi:hypothetical protein